MIDTGRELKLKYVDKQVVIDLAKQINGPDVREFLREHGDLEYYDHQLALHKYGHGQAFFNALDTRWKDLLNGTPEDPFYSNSEGSDYSVALAVAWLTAQEIANS